MSLKITAKVEEQLKNSQIIWITTVRADGTPQPTPVWYLWHNQEFLIFTREAAIKVRNIRTNPHVALNLNTDAYGGSVTVINGEARIDTAPVPADQVALYVEKYREGIKSLGMTPDQMTATFNFAIRVTPNRIRGEE